MKFLVRIFFLLAGMAWLSIAQAETIHIVCYGGSNTYGRGVSRTDAYPAQLEAILRAKGYDVSVKNEGVNGQTTSDELRNLNSAVPDGTAIVIFQPGGNDRVKGGNTEENSVAIVKNLLDRTIDVIFSGPPAKRKYVQSLNISTVDEISHQVPDELQRDKQHLTPKGYHIVAENLLPVVEKLIQNRLPR